jgi:hypothetical protein
LAQFVTLEALRRDGYGVVTLKRPQPNTITIDADVGGRRRSLLVDTAWGGDGIGVLGGAAPTKTAPVTGSAIPVTHDARATVAVGNVRLTDVPIVEANHPQLKDPSERKLIAADGVIGAAFLRTCSGLVDLQNLRIYLRPPGHGHRVAIGRALNAAGLAEVTLQETPQGPALVDAEINGFPGKMVVATGAFHAVVKNTLAAAIKARPIATRAGHPRPQTQDEFARVTLMDPHSREVRSLVENAPMTPLQSFKLGGIPARAPDIRLRKLDPSQVGGTNVIGLLGMDILGANGAIINFAEQKLHFLRGS